MLIFLSVFILLYGGMHAYLFFKAKAAFAFDLPTGIIAALFLLLMVLAPVLVHFFERREWETTAGVSAYIGYTWMALLFLFFSSSLLVDACRLLLHALALLAHIKVSHFDFSAQLRFFAPALFSAAAVLYGWHEAGNIRLERLVLTTPKLPANVGSLKIVQISDVHLGLTVGQRRLRQILNLVNASQPDIVISTGDLVDGEACQNEAVIQLLSSINPRLGKYAITGNHEFYAGINRALECTERAGFKILRGEMVEVAGINIAGVDDPQGRSFGNYAQIEEKGLLSIGRDDRFTLLLKHRPEVDPEAVGLFDLQLSGHTHKGQLYPFTLLVRLFYPRDAGTFELAKGSRLHVSRGSGTWGPPIRFLAPPEVTVIELIHGEM